jgi:8-oxo-dGTP pyrophosphatase MutT (NUDIX family)
MRLPHEVLVGVVRAGEILVLLRSKDRYWHLVAGGLEPGESAAQAAARELQEETGLVAEPRDLSWSFTYRLDEHPHWRALFAVGVEDILVEVLAADAPPGWEPVLNEEHTDYRWAGLEDALALLHYPEPRELAVQLLS